MWILVTYSKVSGWLVHLRTEELAGTNSRSSCLPLGGCSSQTVNRGDICYLLALLPIRSFCELLPTFCDNEVPVNQGAAF